MSFALLIASLLIAAASAQEGLDPAAGFSDGFAPHGQAHAPPGYHYQQGFYDSLAHPGYYGVGGGGGGFFDGILGGLGGNSILNFISTTGMMVIGGAVSLAIVLLIVNLGLNFAGGLLPTLAGLLQQFVNIGGTATSRQAGGSQPTVQTGNQPTLDDLTASVMDKLAKVSDVIEELKKR